MRAILNPVENPMSLSNRCQKQQKSLSSSSKKRDFPKCKNAQLTKSAHKESHQQFFMMVSCLSANMPSLWAKMLWNTISAQIEIALENLHRDVLCKARRPSPERWRVLLPVPEGWPSRWKSCIEREPCARDWSLKGDLHKQSLTLNSKKRHRRSSTEQYHRNWARKEDPPPIPSLDPSPHIGQTNTAKQ